MDLQYLECVCFEVCGVYCATAVLLKEGHVLIIIKSYEGEEEAQILSRVEEYLKDRKPLGVVVDVRGINSVN